MKRLPQISDAEFEVMNVIWGHAPVSTNEIVEALSKYTAWRPKTIQTMLARLEKKGVITHEKESRVFVYSPLIDKEAYLYAEGNAFVDRFFDGACSRMVVRYLEQSALTDEEIDDLQSILDKKRKQ
ncbi:MAG: BlaI/MecI/CopY family transcriptional regulator [Peptococcaceae bacterium]|nr:BlaI/MecI/CopY family transcriptional regulator [Peptococcaceae bacterium]